MGYEIGKVNGMGRRGPAPLPTAVKKMRGTLKKCRTRSAELATTPGIPPMPRGLSPVARSVWRRVVREMADKGILTMADGEALEAYASNFAAARRYQAMADKEPMIDSPLGMRVNPATNAALKSWNAVRAFAAEFGLTPSARSRISAPEQKAPADRSEDFLFGAPGLRVVADGAK